MNLLGHHDDITPDNIKNTILVAKKSWIIRKLFKKKRVNFSISKIPKHTRRPVFDIMNQIKKGKKWKYSFN